MCETSTNDTSTEKPLDRLERIMAVEPEAKAGKRAGKKAAPQAKAAAEPAATKPRRRKAAA